MANSVLIVGAGAVGLGIGSCIGRASDWELTIVARSSASKLSEHGIFQSGIFGEHLLSPSRFNAFSSLDNIQKSCLPFTDVLVCTKSFDAEAAAHDLSKNKQLLAPNARIVLFHNGWGSSEPFAVHFAKEQIFNARVITGFKRPELHRVEITVHADDIRIGNVFYPALSFQLEKLASTIDRGGIPTQISQDVEKEIWSKMLYNCALNPLGAVLGVNYGALADSPHTRFLMEGIIEEIYSVMKAHSFTTFWPDAPGFIEQFYSVMVPRTYAHEPSTLQDLRAKRRTEIDYLSGAIIKLGKKAGVPTPYNQAVYEQVRFLELSQVSSTFPE